MAEVVATPQTGAGATATDGEQRRRAYEGVTQTPLTALSVVFLVVYAYPIIRPGISAGVRWGCELTGYLIWVVFIADYAVRVGLSRHRLRFVRAHLLDLIIVVVPVFRPLRVLRVFSVSQALLLRSTAGLYLKAAQLLVAATGLVVFVGAVAMLDAEHRPPDATITTFPRALWWAISTITTVGYGDYTPVTGTGGSSPP